MASKYTIGMTAPSFTLKDSDGNTIKLSSFKNKQAVVLIFYPGDMTPGCTKQLCDIRDDYKDFKKMKAAIFGVNHAGADSHNKFIAKYGFQFPILIDTDRKVSKKYGAIKYMFGHESIRRSVVIVGKNGKIAWIKRGMPTDKEILEQLETLK